MKSLKYFFAILCCSCSSYIIAQTTYKDVTIDRDHHDNTVVNVINYNKYPVKVKFQYIAGSKTASWVSYTERVGSYENNYTEVNAKETKQLYIGSKIYGLRLTYVDILQPSVGEKILEGVDAFVSGYEQGRRMSSGQ